MYARSLSLESLTLSKVTGYTDTNRNYSAPQVTRIIIPPDGGWGWVIVAAAFFLNFCIDGITYCFGVFLNDISTDLKEHPTKIAIANSLMTGFYFFSGPLACGLTNTIGFRCVAIIGCIILSSSFLIASYLYNLVMFLIVIGFIAGVGLNMIYTPCILIIGFYFERWRALTTAISVTGTSFGIMAFPPIIQSLLKQFQWRTTFKIISAICLSLILLALTFRPVKPIRIEQPQNNVGATVTLQTLQLPNEDSIGSYEEEDKWKLYSKIKKIVLDKLHKNVEEGDADQETRVVYQEAFSDVVSYIPREFAMSRRASYSGVSQLKDVSTDAEKNEQNWCNRCWHCKGEINRPMHRDDIFYHASLYRLAKKKDKLSSYISVVRVSSSKDLGKHVQAWSVLLHVLTTMLDFKLLKSTAFILLLASGFFTMLGFYAIFVFIIARALEIGLDEDSGSLLLTIIGIASAVGRISCGILSCIPHADLLIFSYVTLFIAGIATIASAYLNNWIGQVIFASLFGFNTASFHVLRTVVLADMLGLEKLTNAFGINVLFYGISSFIGIPLAGVIQNASGAYSYCFLYAGCSILVSAILLVPIARIKKMEDRQTAAAANT